MQVTISINEQTLTKILQALAQALPAAPTAEPSQAAQPQLDALQKANASLWNRVQAMQKEISSLQAQLAKPQSGQMASAGPGCQAQSSQAAQPAQALSNGLAVRTVQPDCKSQAQHGEAQGKAKQEAQPPDEEKAEAWTREHIAEWLDTPCTFAKAQGRTWRQMAENQGEKIEMKGRPCSPRAYLHALEGWNTCKVWQRVKARVALEVGKNGNGIT